MQLRSTSGRAFLPYIKFFLIPFLYNRRVRIYLSLLRSGDVNFGGQSEPVDEVVSPPGNRFDVGHKAQNAAQAAQNDECEQAGRQITQFPVAGHVAGYEKAE